MNFRELIGQWKTVAAGTIGFSIAGAAALYFPLCTKDGCTIQGWMSATSGYVAAFAALITLVVLQRQVRDQNRQIKFLLGENPPQAEFWTSSELGSAFIRLVNWNQTKFVINAVSIDAPIALTIHEFSVRTRRETENYSVSRANITLEKGNLREPVSVRGWENRSQDPPEIFLEVIAWRADRKPTSKDDQRTATLFIEGHLSGATREKIVVTVFIPLGELVFA